MGEIRRPEPGRSPFDAIMHTADDGSEWWSAREMMPLMGYTKWQKMQDAIERAKLSCQNAGQQPPDHFTGAGKISYQAYVTRPGSDVRMTRYGCYLLAMNGDPRKPEVAAAQQYFAMMTRAAEKASAAPVVVDDQPKRWMKRLRETMIPHHRYVIVHHPGCFTVATAIENYVLHLEDELIRHLFNPKPSDRPDVSVGLCWGNERRRLGLPPPDRVAPLWLPDQGREVELHVYDFSEYKLHDLVYRHLHAGQAPELPREQGGIPGIRPASTVQRGGPYLP